MRPPPPGCVNSAWSTPILRSTHSSASTLPVETAVNGMFAAEAGFESVLLRGMWMSPTAVVAHAGTLTCTSRRQRPSWMTTGMLAADRHVLQREGAVGAGERRHDRAAADLGAARRVALHAGGERLHGRVRHVDEHVRHRVGRSVRRDRSGDDAPSERRRDARVTRRELALEVLARRAVGLREREAARVRDAEATRVEVRPVVDVVLAVRIARVVRARRRLRLEILRLEAAQRRRRRALHIDRIADARSPLAGAARRLAFGAGDVRARLADDGAARGLRAVRRTRTADVRRVAVAAVRRFDRSVRITEVGRTARARGHRRRRAHASEHDPRAQSQDKPFHGRGSPT